MKDIPFRLDPYDVAKEKILSGTDTATFTPTFYRYFLIILKAPVLIPVTVSDAICRTNNSKIIPLFLSF